MDDLLTLIPYKVQLISNACVMNLIVHFLSALYFAEYAELNGLVEAITMSDFYHTRETFQ